MADISDAEVSAFLFPGNQNPMSDQAGLWMHATNKGGTTMIRP
ncbi:MAG: hypothetical protein SPE81_05800 [Agathobacter sp.]|nr:hypothetical protein [Agathobacter sp.]